MQTILIIEDDESIRESVEEILTEEGFKVLSARDGSSGVDIAKEQIPDLILCDIMMPRLDGYGTLEKLRQDERTALIPFVFLTAKAERHDLRHGMNLGADDYLFKPFTINDLLQTIESRLNRTDVFKKNAENRLEELRASISLSLPHELNTPLSGIMGFSEMIMQDVEELSKEEISDMAACIFDSATRLRRTIERVLTSARLQLLARKIDEMEMLRKERSLVNNDLVQEVIQSQPAAFKDQTQFRISLEKSEVAIDEGYLKVVVLELLDNCVKFSAEGSPVMVTGMAEDGRYMLNFADRGRGMSPEQINNIGAFVQFERKLYEQQGSGLGLSIVSNIVELFNGGIDVVSELNKGTTITVTFAVAPREEE